MVRVPKTVMDMIDAAVGMQYTSRPDFVVEAIRNYMDYVSSAEAETVALLKEKDVSYAAKLEFYFEALEIRLTPDRNLYRVSEERSEGKSVEVLLSVLPGLIAEMNDIVVRTKAFRNGQEFIKMAIIHLISSMSKRGADTRLTIEFLQNSDLKGMKEELDKLREEFR